MKKCVKWLGMFAALLCLCFGAAACGGDKGDGKLEGIYTYKETSRDGTKIVATIELKEDKTYVAEVKFNGVPDEEERGEGTYTVTDNVIVFTDVDDYEFRGTIVVGKSITLADDDSEDPREPMVYKK